MREPSIHPPWLLLRFNELALVVAILVVVVITAAVDSNHSYLNQPYTSLRDIARNVSLLGIFSLGAAVVIIAGGIDLSAGSMIAFSSTICATTMVLFAPQMLDLKPVGPLVATLGILAAIISGLLVGTLHAWLITSVRLPPFVATLATLVGLRSFARAYLGYITAKTLGGSGNTEINVYDQYFRYMREEVWTVYVPTFLLLAAFTYLLLNYTVLGRHLYALGGNEQAARLSGIRTDAVKWFAYCFSAVTAAIAGVFYMADQSVASPVTQGIGYELNAIAAAVVGGCSLQGGIGTVPGVILGVVFLRVVIDSVAKLIKSGSDIYEGMIVGIVVVIAVTFSQLRQIRSSGRELFPGVLGLIAIPALAAMSGLITAMTIANVEYLKGRDIWIGAGVALAILAGLAIVKFTQNKASRA
jgi:ribose/xylose/arabinose/galactoside ABC-type transport system permease subunit